MKGLAQSFKKLNKKIEVLDVSIGDRFISNSVDSVKQNDDQCKMIISMNKEMKHMKESQAVLDEKMN